MSWVEPDILRATFGVLVPSGDLSATIIGPVDLLRHPARTITVINLGPVTLSGVSIEVNPDGAGVSQNATINGDTNQIGSPPNPNLWITYDNTTLNSIGTGAGTGKGTTLPGLYRWWRARATNNQTQSITASGYIYASSMS